MNRIFLLFCTLCCLGTFGSVSAQVRFVLVKDSVTNAPLSRAPCELLGHSGPAGAMIMVFTDDTGVATLKETMGANKVRVMYQGYTAKTVPLKASGDTLFIQLASLEIVLSEVNIVGHRKMVKQTPKGSVLDLTKVKEANLWQLSDALKQIPGVSVDPTSNSITYQGKPIPVQVNGMTAGETRMEAPANQYSAVELVLYDPKSQHDGPVLNLVKAKREEPFWGNIHTWGSLNGGGVRPGIGFHKGIQTLDISANYSGNSNPTSSSNGTMKIPQQEFYREFSGSSKNKVHSAFPSPSLRYTLEFKKHLIDLSLTYMKQYLNYNSSSFTKEYESNSLKSDYSQELDRDVENINKQMEIGYLFTINKNNKLHAKLSAISPEIKTDENLSFQGNGASVPLGSYLKSQIEKRTEYFSSVSYEHWNQQLGAFEGGVKYFNRKMDKSLTYIPIKADGSESPEEKADYLNKYFYIAGFASWTKQIKDFSIYLVLKQDYSQDRIPTTDNAKFTFSCFSPYLSLQQRIGNHNFGLILNYNEKRPSLSELNPVAEPGNQNGSIILKGNPNLRTVKAYKATASYSSTFFKKLDANLSFGYEYDKDPIKQFRTLVDGTSIMEVTSVNLGWEQQIYSDVMLRYSLTSKWKVSVEGSINHNQSHWDSNVDKYQTLRGRISSEYTLKKWQFGVSGDYLEFSNFQFSNSGVWNYGLNARYTAPSNWNFSLGITNPLPYYRQNNTSIVADGYQNYSESKMRQFNINASVMYRFGKAKSAKSTKQIKVDDM